MPDYYRQLGIASTATDAQVRRAVRRYWQRVARFRLASEQQAFLAAAAVLSNPHLRAVYDPTYQPGPDPARLQANALRHLSHQLRTELHQAQARAYRLEHEVRRLRIELGHALNYPDEMAASRQARRHQWRKLLLLLLLPVAYGLLRGLGTDGGLASLSGPPYQPVAESINWLVAQRDSTGTYTQVEQMPQYPGGAGELQDFLRQQVYARAAKPVAERLCATGQLRFVVDSAGWVRGPAQVLGLPTRDLAGRQLLQQAVARLPRLVPAYQRARPVPVRLTVPLSR